MKALLDFLPLLLFFGAYRYYDIYVGTAVLMGATVVQMGVIFAMDGKLQGQHKLTLLLVLVFGALTLALHDERFIKWKPTVLYVLLAAGMAAAHWIKHKNVPKLLLGAQIELTDAVWQRLAFAWIGYALFMAALNAYVVVYYSTEDWVRFKLWGYVFPVAFLLAQGIYIAQNLRERDGSSAGAGE